MSKSFWNTLGDAIGAIAFIKYGLPIILIILISLLGVAMFNKWNVASHTDKTNSILYTDFEKTIYDIATKTVNSNEFELKLTNTDFYDVELTYIVKNKDYTLDKYIELFKAEITKIYNEVKNKEILNDTLFGEDENIKTVEIFFSLEYNEGYEGWLGGTRLKYSTTDKWEKGYQKAIEDNITTQEKFNKVKSKGM